jgi:hypothetical protein
VSRLAFRIVPVVLGLAILILVLVLVPPLPRHSHGFYHIAVVPALGIAVPLLARAPYMLRPTGIQVALVVPAMAALAVAPHALRPTAIQIALVVSAVAVPDPPRVLHAQNRQR